MKKRKIGFNLYYIFIVSIIIPFLIVSIIFMFYYNHIFMKLERQNMSNILNSVTKNIESQFQELDNIGKTYYMHNDIFQEIESLNKPDLYQYYDDLKMIKMHGNYAVVMTKLMHTSNLSIKGITFFAENEKIEKGYYIGKSSAELQTITDYDYKSKKWYKQALYADGQATLFPGHIQEYREGNTDIIYSYIRAIKDMDTRKTMGVVKIDVSIDDLIETLNVVEGEAGLALLNKGKMVAKSSNLTGDEFHILDGKKCNLGDKNYYYQSTEMKFSGWELIYVLDTDVFWSGYRYAVGIVLVVMLASVFLAFLIYRMHSKTMLRDMEQITSAIRQIETGNMDVVVDVKGENELQDIATAINHMVYNLKRYIDQEYILVINQQKAQYSALQAQINPHFLYNTLTGFIALNRMGEKKILEQSIISLKHLFQYTCKNQDITTIQKEFDFLEEYLKLEKLKYEKRVEYMVWMEEECKHFEIPKLLLQPIVENSIIHGMGDADIPIMITMVAKRSEVKGIGNVIVLSIRDNGVGFDTKDLSEDKNSVGVINVQRRAEIYCKDVIYQVFSEIGKGTKTTFIFPERESDFK